MGLVRFPSRFSLSGHFSGLEACQRIVARGSCSGCWPRPASELQTTAKGSSHFVLDHRCLSNPASAVGHTTGLELTSEVCGSHGQPYPLPYPHTLSRDWFTQALPLYRQNCLWGVTGLVTLRYLTTKVSNAQLRDSLV